MNRRPLGNPFHAVVRRLMAARLKRARLAVGLRQEDVSRRTGISQGVISQYESGRLTVPAERLFSLSRLYGVSADWLLGLTDDAAPPGDVRDVDWFGESAVARDLEVTERELHILRGIIRLGEGEQRLSPLQWAVRLMRVRRMDERLRVGAKDEVSKDGEQ